ncbi:MAG: EF-hand domain-containing protein [Rubrivivax sp.]|nr:MAG: EF-hand domain-containing protein [Rubrivivax sp.]
MNSMIQRSLHLASVSFLAAALPLAAMAQSGTRTEPVAPNGVVTAPPVVVPSDTQAKSVEAAFQSADANQDGLLSPDEVLSVPALASEFRNFDKNGDGALSLTEIQTARPVDPQPLR